MRRGQAGLRLILLVAVPLVAVAGGAFWWLSGGRYVSTDNAYVKAHIVQIAPEVSGQVRRVLVRDHQAVSAGESLMTIESRPFKLALDMADAEARAEFFKKQWQRQEELGVRGIASVAKREESQNDARAAADRVASVR